jgi:hypothetical protein
VHDRILENDFSLTADVALRSPWLQVVDEQSTPQNPYIRHDHVFSTNEQRTPLLNIPGVAYTSWTSAAVDLDLISFSALNMGYTRIARTVEPVSGGYTNALLATISDRWTGAAMPLTGSANYSGYTYATADFVDLTTGSPVVNQYIATAPFSLSANFATMSVAGGASGFSLYDLTSGAPLVSNPLPGLSFQFTGQISGDKFVSGNVATNGGGSAAVSTFGSLTGRFSGPNAEETGGVYFVGGNRLIMRGGFLAKR